MRQPQIKANPASSKVRTSTKAAAPIHLTVCMPTYNRGDLLSTLIRAIIPILMQAFGANFEVVVSDNHSNDDTSAKVAAIMRKNPAVRVVRPPQHYPTAEENLHFALGECRGDYVWILGDDDSVEASTVMTLKEYVARGEHDLLIFNSRSHSYTGEVLKNIRIPCLAPVLEAPLLDFVALSGFWFVISGFSTTVVKRSALDLALFREILSIGKIYAQVTWLIAQFHDKRFAFINQPLVAYRQNVSDVKPTGHWEHVAKREKLFPRAIWTTGFLRQLDFLVQKEVFGRRFVATVIDRNIENRFYFCDEVFLHMINSIIEWLNEKRQPIPPAECYYFIDWMNDLWPNNICFISAMEKLFESVFEHLQFDREQLDIAAGIINDRKQRPWYANFHRLDAYGYSIYEHVGRWFAIRIGEDRSARDWLENLDFTSLDDVVVVGGSFAELMTELQTKPPRILDTTAQTVRPQPDILQQLEAERRDHAALQTALAQENNSLAETVCRQTARVQELETSIGALDEELVQHKAREQDLETQISAVRSSTSWKITAPMRALVSAIRG